MPQLKATPAEAHPEETPSTKADLTLLALVKHSRRQPRKHSEQVNIAIVLDICFLMNKFDLFVNKNANTQPAQYITSRQKKITGLFEKSVFKVFIIDDIPSNT